MLLSAGEGEEEVAAFLDLMCGDRWGAECESGPTLLVGLAGGGARLCHNRSDYRRPGKPLAALSLSFPICNTGGAGVPAPASHV